MPITLEWTNIAIRLGLTFLAGGLIGLNRGERGRPAGLRTILLVCLAASLSMIQANLLLATAGRTPDSFVSFDVMRLPLGILSGMGFIGAGAIMRRDNLVVGITTAATLWFSTVMSLCFGGGQLRLGLAALVLGLIVLWALKWVEQHTNQDRRGEFIVFTTAGLSEADILASITPAGYRVVSRMVTYRAHPGRHRLSFELEWRARPIDSQPPVFLSHVASQPGVLRVEWKPRRV